MTRKRKADGMVPMLVLVPKALRAELEMIRTRDGVPLSQQVRLSLTHWCRAVSKNPHGAQGLLGNEVARHYKLGTWIAKGPDDGSQDTNTPVVELGPEPDPETQPAAWAKWSAKAGNAAIAKLAKGDWGE